MHRIIMRRLDSPAARKEKFTVGICDTILTFNFGVAEVDDEEIVQQIREEHRRTYIIERVAAVDPEPVDADIEAPSDAQEADPVLPVAPTIPVLSDEALASIKKLRSADKIINTVLAEVGDSDPDAIYKLLVGLRGVNKSIKMPRTKLRAALKSALRQASKNGASED